MASMEEYWTGFGIQDGSIKLLEDIDESVDIEWYVCNIFKENIAFNVKCNARDQNPKNDWTKGKSELARR